MADALSPLVACAALVVSVAALAKLRSPATAVSALQTLGVPLRARPVRVLALLELGVGVAALTEPGPLTSALLAGLYGAFALVSVGLRRHSAQCGCFGQGEVPASWVQSVLNGLLAAVCLAAAIGRLHEPEWVLSQPELLIGIAGLAYATVTLYTELPRAWSAWGGA